MKVKRRMVVKALCRAGATTALLVTAYYALPFTRLNRAPDLLLFLLGLIALGAVMAWQVVRIIQAKYPAVQAIEALAVSAPLFLLMFSSTYYVLAHGSPSDFSQPMTRTDALYFTMTTFSTVGFGDITATSQGARGLVIVQEVLDLVLLGLGARVVIGAVRIGQGRRSADSDGQPRGSSPLPPQR